MMNLDFRFAAVPMQEFAALFSLSDEQLAEHRGRRMSVDHSPGTPCRVSLQDAAVGERVILIPFKHHDVDSPFQSSGPVFVREAAIEAVLPVNQVPVMLVHRTLSVRAYDAGAMMVDGAVVAGSGLSTSIRQFLAKREIAYLHVHNAGVGCFLASVERA